MGQGRIGGVKKEVSKEITHEYPVGVAMSGEEGEGESRCYARRVYLRRVAVWCEVR
jgi:hypothetical protein